MAIGRIFLIIFFFFSFAVQAQHSLVLQGEVLDVKTNKPVPMATVVIADAEKWAVTNDNGYFQIVDLKEGTYTLQFSCLGYANRQISLQFSAQTKKLRLMVSQATLELQEVVVVAKEGKLETVSKINQDAIRHVQAKSLDDVLQLMPGQITKNPTLAAPAQVQIRELDTNNNSALGAAVIVDGAPMSNNANLQITSTARSGIANNAPSVAGSGIDLRRINVDNIASVEVIRGIPSAEYGDLTSGAVIVKTKAGKTPYEANLKIDPETKIFFLGKGFLLPKENGALNFGVDYTQSYPDKRRKFEGFERITASLGYTNTFFKTGKPLTLNTRFSYYQTIDDAKSDPELLSKEVINSKYKGLRFALNGKWQLDYSWLTNLSYNVATSFTHNEDYTYDLKTLSAGTMPLATSFEEGEHEVNFIPGEYYAEMTIDGKPFHLFAQLKGNKVWQSENWRHNLKLGIEWRADGNNGKGKQFDLNFPPVINSISTLRPRAYKDIPSMHTMAMFLENRFGVTLGKTELTGQIGFRYNNSQPRGLLDTHGAQTFEPRANLRYQIFNLKNNNWLDDLSLRIGYGKASKMPTLLHLYPDKAYFDESSFNYYDGADNALAVVTTKIVEDTNNPNLKPIYNNKYEIGVDVQRKKMSAKITGYYEKQTGGFDFDRVPIYLQHNEYKIDRDDVEPYFIEGEGVFYNDNGQVIAANMVQDTAFRFYRRPVNDQVRIKKGLEYVLNLGKIKPIRTDLVLDGAWLYTKTYNTRNTYQSFGTSYNGKRFPYIAVFDARETRLRQRLNTNVRAITHIPNLKMVVSLTAQLVWFNKVQYAIADANGNNPVYVTKDGVKIKVDDVEGYRGDGVQKNVDPIGYIDRAGNYYEWDPSMYNQEPFRTMVNRYSDFYFLEESYPFVAQFNFRLTKELANNLDLSFTANNFFNHRPYHKLDRSDGYARRNSALYFGAEVKLKF